MSIIRKNFSANVASKAVYWGLNLVSVPYFANVLGTEAYGVVSIYGIILSAVALLDLGMSAAVNNCLSSADGAREAMARALLTAYEKRYWMLALGLLLAGALSADLLARRWFNFTTISTGTAAVCVALAAGSAALRFPMFLYLGIYRGLERQKLESFLACSMVLLRLGIAVAAIHLIRRSPVVYLAAQLVATVVEISVYRSVLRLPARSAGASLDRGILLKSAGGYAIVGALMGLAYMGERLVASNLLEEQALAALALAMSCSSIFSVVSGALGLALFPRLSALKAQNAGPETRQMVTSALTRMLLLNAALYGSLLLLLPHVLPFFIKDGNLRALTLMTFKPIGLGVCLTTGQDVLYVLHMAHRAFSALITNAIIVLLVTYAAAVMLIHQFGVRGLGYGSVLASICSFAFLGMSTRWRWTRIAE